MTKDGENKTRLHNAIVEMQDWILWNIIKGRFDRALQNHSDLITHLF